MTTPLLELKKSAFVLWRPMNTAVPPKLVIGQFLAGNPPTLVDRQKLELRLVPGQTDLWHIPACECGLTDHQVCHYWFECSDSNPFRDGRRISCTDPTALTVDWRLQSEPLPAPYNNDDRNPAAVVKYIGGILVPCDAAGETFEPAPPIPANEAQSNNLTVIYELPTTTWTRVNIHEDPEVGVGTFRDVLALIDPDATGANFEGMDPLQRGRSYLGDLGINALELLPPADSFVDREWGYATSNYFAPDHDLGFPAGNSSPTANTDLIQLVTACHEAGIRFFIDVVMAFGNTGGAGECQLPRFSHRSHTFAG